MLTGILNVDDFTGLDSNIQIEFVAPIVVRSHQPSSSSDTLTLRRVVSGMNAQRWEFQVKLMPAYYQSFIATMMMRGHTEKYAIRPPQPERSAHLAPRVELVTGYNVGPPEYLEGDTTLYLDNAQAPANTFLPGDFITIRDIGSPAYTKLHMVTAASDFLLEIWPGVSRTLVGVPAIYSGRKAKGYFYLDVDTPLAMTYQDGIIADFGTLTFVEAL